MSYQQQQQQQQSPLPPSAGKLRKSPGSGIAGRMALMTQRGRASDQQARLQTQRRTAEARREVDRGFFLGTEGAEAAETETGTEMGTRMGTASSPDLPPPAYEFRERAVAPGPSGWTCELPILASSLSPAVASVYPEAIPAPPPTQTTANGPQTRPPPEYQPRETLQGLQEELDSALRRVMILQDDLMRKDRQINLLHLEYEGVQARLIEEACSSGSGGGGDRAGEVRRWTDKCDGLERVLRRREGERKRLQERLLEAEGRGFQLERELNRVRHQAASAAAAVITTTTTATPAAVASLDSAREQRPSTTLRLQQESDDFGASSHYGILSSGYSTSSGASSTSTHFEAPDPDPDREDPAPLRGSSARPASLRRVRDWARRRRSSSSTSSTATTAVTGTIMTTTTATTAATAATTTTAVAKKAVSPARPTAVSSTAPPPQSNQYSIQMEYPVKGSRPRYVMVVQRPSRAQRAIHG